VDADDDGSAAVDFRVTRDVEARGDQTPSCPARVSSVTLVIVASALTCYFPSYLTQQQQHLYSGHWSHFPHPIDYCHTGPLLAASAYLTSTSCAAANLLPPLPGRSPFPAEAVRALRPLLLFACPLGASASGTGTATGTGRAGRGTHVVPRRADLLQKLLPGIPSTQLERAAAADRDKEGQRVQSWDGHACASARKILSWAVREAEVATSNAQRVKEVGKVWGHTIRAESEDSDAARFLRPQ